MAKKNVNLRILNKQYRESLEPVGEAFSRKLDLEDEIEILTEATLYHRGGATYIAYDEPEQTGFDNDRTVIKLADGKLSIKRYGGDSEGQMDLILEEGVMNITTYVVPMARFEIGVYTNEIGHDLTDEGYGRIFADYSISFSDIGKTRNKLEIDISDNAGFNTSLS